MIKAPAVTVVLEAQGIRMSQLQVRFGQSIVGKVLSVRVVILVFALGTSSMVFAQTAFTIGRLRYSGGGDWYSNPSSLPNLQLNLKQITDMDIENRERVVSLKDNSVHNTSVLYMTGHGNVSFSQEELSRLRAYLENGGFLWADDNFGMDESFRRQMKLLFPDNELVKISSDHPIFHCLYSFPRGLPKIHEHNGGSPEAYGIFLNGRMIVFYSFNTDIGDGLEDPDVHSDSPEKRKEAMEMAVNVIVYALSN